MKPCSEISQAHRSEPGAEERIAAVVAGLRQFSELSPAERELAHAYIDAFMADRLHDEWGSMENWLDGTSEDDLPVSDVDELHQAMQQPDSDGPTTFTPAKLGPVGPTQGQRHAMRSAVKRQPLE